MGNLVLTGATSGSATVQATDAATVTITLPATSGTLALTSGGGSPTYTTITTTNDATISGLTVGKGSGGYGNNTVVGKSALVSNSVGEAIVAIGQDALTAHTTNNHIVAVGYQALKTDTTGFYNVAVGSQSLYSNTTASNNTAVGYVALYANTTGAPNTAVGTVALYSNTTGTNNVAVGGGLYGSTNGALTSNTTGSYNTGLGVGALGLNTTASNNTAVGYQAGYSQTSGGTGNAFLGYQAGYSNAGSNNTFIGYQAGYAVNTYGSNTFIGSSAGSAVTTGYYNTIIGSYTGNQGGLDIRTATNYIVLSDGQGNPRGYFDNSGYFKASTTSSTLSDGSHQFGVNNSNSYCLIAFNSNASPAGEYIIDSRFTASSPNNTNARFLACTDTTNEKAAILSNGGYLSRNNSYGTYSDQKLKENIVDATSKLDKVNQLKVRNFNFIGDELKQIGFIAQEFEQVFPSLVEESQDKNLEETTKSIKTSVLVPILVKAIQELNAKVTALEAQLGAK